MSRYMVTVGCLVCRFSAVVPEKAKLNYKRAPVSAVAQDAAAGARAGKGPGMRSDRMMKKVSPSARNASALLIPTCCAGCHVLTKASRLCVQLADIGKRSKASGKAAKVSVEGRGMAVG